MAKLYLTLLAMLGVVVSIVAIYILVIMIEESDDKNEEK